jgi:hypothetical protein
MCKFCQFKLNDSDMAELEDVDADNTGDDARV